MPRKKKARILDEDEGGDQDVVNMAELKVNAQYAKRFEEKEQKRDLQRAREMAKQERPKQRNNPQSQSVWGKHVDQEDARGGVKRRYEGGDDDDEYSSSSSDPEDDDSQGELDTEERHDAFLRILPLVATSAKDATEHIRQKKGIYDPDVKVFEQEESRASQRKSGDSKRKEKKAKPVRLTDYLRDTLLEYGAEGIDEDEALRKHVATAHGGDDLPLVEQQALLKRQLLEAGNSDSDDGDFLTIRKKTAADEAREAKEFKEFKEAHPGAFAGDADELSALKSFWTADSGLSEEDKFLRDYVLNKRWIERDSRPSYDEIVGKDYDEEDDEALDAQEEFEHAYNFRFEEPGGAHIQSHPRPRMIEDSVRRDTKAERKAEARKARRLRKQDEKAMARQETDHLRKAKEQDIQAKLDEIRKIAGGDVPFTAEDLAGDWDPEAFDRRMEQLFNEEWQQGDEPERPDIGLEEDIEDPSHYAVAEESSSSSSDSESESGDYVEDDDGEPEFKSKHKSRKAFLRTREKALLDSKAGELGDLLAAYQNLEYEDIIDNDIKCRFKYTKVPAETYGLSIAEILEMDDKELNQRVSMKRLAPYKHMYPNARNRHDDSKGNATDYDMRSSHARQHQQRAEASSADGKKGRTNAERRAAKKAWKQQQQ